MDWDKIESAQCEPIAVDRRLGFLELFDNKLATSDHDDAVSSSDQELFAGF